MRGQQTSEDRDVVSNNTSRIQGLPFRLTVLVQAQKGDMSQTSLRCVPCGFDKGLALQ